MWSPDGERIVALRGNAYDRDNSTFDFGVPGTSNEALTFGLANQNVVLGTTGKGSASLRFHVPGTAAPFQT